MAALKPMKDEENSAIAAANIVESTSFTTHVLPEVNSTAFLSSSKCMWDCNLNVLYLDDGIVIRNCMSFRRRSCEGGRIG